ncbi:hypothetical protein DFH05DRAFT_1595529 [Lentinula detonsa]|uniref:DUF6830 domain-containing protein n=1 Tax=Lentinula detonsa TaxID=2804962 RepID=A0A9W8TSZ7_9AGAR|nr:hypothetical protein DFH05DRAFT_1595529 [Lentinula detonsa]
MLAARTTFPLAPSSLLPQPVLDHDIDGDEDVVAMDGSSNLDSHVGSCSGVATDPLGLTHHFPEAAHIEFIGQTALDEFNDDRFATERQTNLYYPMANHNEWQLASWLLNSDLSMSQIDEYLKLELTKKQHLSFQTAKELKARMELLPPVARWKSKKLTMDIRYPTKKPVYLFYRDAMEVLQDLLKSPLIHDHITFTPLQIFETAARTTRVYDSWLSSDRAWRLQSELPPGRTLLGTILSSDKTNISIMVRNRCAHPLLISSANIKTEMLSKAGHHLLQLLALLPIPVFREKSQDVRGILENRLFHRSLDIVLRPLKVAASIGHLMADPVGQVRRCHTPCAAWIVDTPEASLISCVGRGGKTSPYTTAIYKDYGDSFRHPTRTGNSTLAMIDQLTARADPNNIRTFQRWAQKGRMNGIIDPCWRNWPSSDPGEFLLPEILHYWHKFFFDHDMQWCINVVGAEEIDFRYSLITKKQGFRSFPEGISQLRQVTGRDQREIQRYIVSRTAGATSNKFLTAIRALCDFRYAGHAPRFNNATAAHVQLALDEFHEVKDEVIQLRGRLNSKGELLKTWEIPKLEFMQSVFPSIKASGPIIQWDANKSERAHITLVKLPARAGNSQNYEIQICRHLDLHSRMRNFDLMTAMKDVNVEFRLTTEPEDGDAGSREGMTGAAPSLVATTSALVSNIVPVSSKVLGSIRPKKDFFLLAADLRTDPNTPSPLPTFTNGDHTAFHLLWDPDLKTLSLDDVQRTFNLPDFFGAVLDYLDRANTGTHIFSIRGQRTPRDVSTLHAPFRVKVWSKLSIQGRQYHNIHLPNETHTIFAAPPGSEYKFGRSDCVVFNIDAKKIWPRSSLEGHAVAIVKVVFAPAYGRYSTYHHPRTDEFLAYCERYDVVNQPPPPAKYTHLPCYQAWKPYYPDYASGCYVLKKALRTNGTPFGDIVPISQFRAQVDLAPYLQGKADSHLSPTNVMTYAPRLLLNKYWEKELWYALDKSDPCSSSAA